MPDLAQQLTRSCGLRLHATQMGKQPSHGLPPAFWDLIRTRVPGKSLDFLLGDRPLESFELAVTFASVYPLLLATGGLSPPEPSHDFVARSRAFHQNVASRELGAWFQERLVSRWSPALAYRLGPLRRWGLSDADSAEILLYCAMTPYGSRYATGRKPHTFPAEGDETVARSAAGEHLAPGWLNEELMRLACDWGLSGPQANLVLKHLVPETLGIALDILGRTLEFSPGSRAYQALLRVSPELVRKWVDAEREQFRRCYWYARDDGCDGTRRRSLTVAIPTDELTTYNRIRRHPEGLDLCFMENKGAVWYRVDVTRGIVSRLAEPDEDGGRYHLALKRVGRGCTRLHRGGEDILLAFARNASINGVGSSDAVSRRNYWWSIVELLDGHSELLLAKCQQRALLLARSLTRRNSIAWEIYGIILSSGCESVQVSRIRTFAREFPSLFRIVPTGFIGEVVAPGASLRQAIPYWSKPFREAARQASQNYEEARERMMRAALMSMGARPEWIDGCSVMGFLKGLRFLLPFAKQLRHREAFFLFIFRTLAQECRPAEDFVLVYRYVRATGHVCNRYTTFGSLKCRLAAWLREEAQRRAIEEIGDNAPFPEPWLPEAWVEKARRVVYLEDPATLWHHSREQMNCSFSYGTDIRSGEVQFYRLEDSTGQGMATVEVVDDGHGNIVLGERLGPRNEPLPEPEERVIHAWFTQASVGSKGGRLTVVGTVRNERACLMEF